MITFHIHKHLMRPYAQFTWSRPITRPNGMRTICNSPQCGQAQHCSMCRAQWKQWCCISRATPNGEPSHWPSMAGRVATATALGSRDCHHIEATAAPAQMHRSCSAPPLSNAGGKRQALTECGMNARARGEKQHGVGAGRPHSWRLRLGFSPNEAWRAWQRSRFGSAFEREASGRDATLGEQKLAPLLSCCLSAATKNG